ncbi:unnamed protein product [Fusarium venenatum]|uniref:Uncharacterized protein n=1 Tax=Fusarium venenatum TaxID=56646 RepID=A0A2L2TB49_9HYPO|nr:uncharacterized protein FVRRES_06997 [Fusarium venenatum]CEI62561.1 unnamed protein product [Fusarium venenatum]
MLSEYARPTDRSHVELQCLVEPTVESASNVITASDLIGSLRITRVEVEYEHSRVKNVEIVNVGRAQLQKGFDTCDDNVLGLGLVYGNILPLASVFVGNSGYGEVRASLANGTPLVVAGDSEDKPEICAIIEWAGVTVNLRTGNPTGEVLRDGAGKLLSNAK